MSLLDTINGAGYSHLHVEQEALNQIDTHDMSTGTHPYVVSDPEICGGSPRLVGTRITVRMVVIAALLHGQTPEELLQHYPHLTLAAIHDALSYYYDHREAVDREIAEHEALDPGLHAKSVR